MGSNVTFRRGPLRWVTKSNEIIFISAFNNNSFFSFLQPPIPAPLYFVRQNFSHASFFTLTSTIFFTPPLPFFRLSILGSLFFHFPLFCFFFFFWFLVTMNVVFSVSTLTSFDCKSNSKIYNGLLIEERKESWRKMNKMRKKKEGRKRIKVEEKDYIYIYSLPEL